MARNDDDDDDDDRPKKRRARAEEEEDDEGEEEEERPRKKPARDEEDEPDEAPAKGKKPLPGKLVAAAAASMAWGGFNLYFSCIESSNGLLNIYRFHAMRGANDRQFMMDVGGGQGWLYTTAAVYVFSVLFSLLLFVGGMLLIRRMSMGKFAAMGAPVALALTLLIGFVIGLIMTRGTLMGFSNQVIVSFLFTAAVAGCNITMLMSKEVSKALK